MACLGWMAEWADRLVRHLVYDCMSDEECSRISTLATPLRALLALSGHRSGANAFELVYLCLHSRGRKDYHASGKLLCLSLCSFIVVTAISLHGGGERYGTVFNLLEKGTGH